MALTASPSFAARTRPTKLAWAPTSLRPRVMASSSRPVSKSPSCTRTFAATLTSRDRWKERHLVARLHGRGEARHLLVHGHAPGLAGRERLGPAGAAGAEGVDHRADGGPGLERHLLARDTDRLAQAREIEDGDRHG